MVATRMQIVQMRSPGLPHRYHHGDTPQSPRFPSFSRSKLRKLRFRCPSRAESDVVREALPKNLERYAPNPAIGLRTKTARLRIGAAHRA